MRSRSPSWWRARYCIFSNIVRPGTSRTPPTMTRPGSPHACRSTAWTTESKRTRDLALLKLGPQVIGLPVLDERLDLALVGEPFVEHAPHERRKLAISGETQRDELAVRELRDPRLQVRRELLAQPEAHLETDDAVLHR